MITFLVSGVWHGAGWHFIIWGGLHGAFQIIGDMLMPLRRKVVDILHIDTKSHGHIIYQTVGTTFLATIAWIFFRAKSTRLALVYIKRMFALRPSELMNVKVIYNYGLDSVEIKILLLAVLVMFLVGLVRYNMHLKFEEYLAKQNLWFRWLVLFTMLFSILIFGMYGQQFDAQAFIYFQF